MLAILSPSKLSQPAVLPTVSVVEPVGVVVEALVEVVGVVAVVVPVVLVVTGAVTVTYIVSVDGRYQVSPTMFPEKLTLNFSSPVELEVNVYEKPPLLPVTTFVIPPQLPLAHCTLMVWPDKPAPPDTVRLPLIVHACP